MQLFEKWILQRKFLQWHSISKSRGKALRFLREPTKRWRRWVRQQKHLRENENRARRAIRACRINNTLELCLTRLAQSRIENAADVGRWLGTRQPAHVPIANRLDHLFEEYEREAIGPETEEPNAVAAGPKQLYIQGKMVTLSDDNLAGLMVLKQFHWLLSRFSDDGRRAETINTIINPQTTTKSSSLIDRLKNHMISSGVVDIDNDFDNPSTLPDVHILELIMLADEVKSMVEKFNKANPDLNRDLLQQHYILTGSEDTFIKQSRDNNHASGNQTGIDDISFDTDFNASMDSLFDLGEEQSFANYLAEISSTDKSGNHLTKTEHAEPSSLVDVIAADAKTNISVMKLDVDTALHDARSSQTHLMNYKDFIDKKKKQRAQCLRDIQIHCCTCRGPHISKPPFSHGKDYRREPIHGQHQGKNCLFLRKKKAELKWLDETLGNYSKNEERFEREIAKREAETRSRKENMKEALANSLRLMEIASES